MTLSPKIEKHIRDSVDKFLTNLRTGPNVERVNCTFDGSNTLIIRAVHEVQVKAVEIPQSELEAMVSNAKGYVTAKGFAHLVPVYEERVRNTILDYARQGVRVQDVVVKGDKHPFRVKYMAAAE